MHTSWIKSFAAFLAVTVVAILGVEMAGRFYLDSIQTAAILRLADSKYGQLDERLGVRYLPNTSLSFAYLIDGAVKECLPNISVTNADGFRGNDLLADFHNSKYKILFAGDSFSHWNNKGMTIPDFVKKELVQNDLDSSILNTAGGAFGLIHMLANAAYFSEKLKPDSIVIAFVTDDIRRDWWVTGAIVDKDGRVRPRIAKRKEGLEIGNEGQDEYIIDPRVNMAWCEKMKSGGIKNDEIIKSSYEFYHHQNERPLFFFWDRLIFKATGKSIYKKQVGSIPQIQDIESVRSDKNYRNAVSILQDLKIPIHFVHLPRGRELKEKKVSFNALETDILDMMVQDLSASLFFQHDFSDFPTDITWEVSPYDAHPSFDASAFYGKYLARYLIKNNKVKN
jgi:hypothetical protein